MNKEILEVMKESEDFIAAVASAMKSSKEQISIADCPCGGKIKFWYSNYNGHKTVIAKCNQYAIEALKDKLIELSMKNNTPKKYAANMFEAYEVIKQLQNNQRWYNPKDKLPAPDCGVLAIVSGKPHPNTTLMQAYCIAEYDVQDGRIVSEYPECTTLKVEAWMPLPDYYGE